MRLKIHHIFSWILLSILLVRCIGPDVIDDANDIFQLIIHFPAQNSPLGGKALTLTAERPTNGGETIQTTTKTWTNSNTAVAKVSSQG